MPVFKDENKGTGMSWHAMWTGQVNESRNAKEASQRSERPRNGSKIAELEQKLSSRDSIREQMDRGRLKSENDSLRKENQKLRDVLAAHGIPFLKKSIDRDR